MPLSRYTKRHKRTFGKKKEKWDSKKDFRLPPKPDSYYTKVKGQCRWCGLTCLKEDGTIIIRMGKETFKQLNQEDIIDVKAGKNKPIDIITKKTYRHYVKNVIE